MAWPPISTSRLLAGSFCGVLLLAAVATFALRKAGAPDPAKALPAEIRNTRRLPTDSGVRPPTALPLRSNSTTRTIRNQPDTLNPDASRVTMLRDRFAHTDQPAAREDLAREMAGITTHESCEALVSAIAHEGDLDVRLTIWNALATLPEAAPFSTASVESAILNNYYRVDEVDEQQAMLRVAARCGTTTTIALLRKVSTDSQADPDERATANSQVGLLCARGALSLTDSDSAALESSLRVESQAALHPGTRVECLRAIAAMAATDSKSFLAGLLERERDPAVLRVLEELGR